MNRLLKKLFKNQKIKKATGIVLIAFGLIALFTPFTPGSWLIFLGSSYFGFHFLFWKKIKIWLKRK